MGKGDLMLYFKSRRKLVPGAMCLMALIFLAHSAFGQAAVDDDPALAQGWTLQFSDDFGRTELGENWQIVSGNWKVEDRMLHGAGPGTVLCRWSFTGSLRLEFDAIAAEGDVSDLSAILNAKEGGSVSDGYFFGFGSDDNTGSKLLVRGKLATRSDARIVPGRRYHVVCQREGGKLTHMIDGRIIMTYEDEHPVQDTKYPAIGFYTWRGGKFDNVRVYTKDGTASKPAPRDLCLIPTTVSLITGDREPLTTPGPGEYPGGTTHAAFDWNYRSLFVDLGRERTVSRIMLRSNPHALPTHTQKTSNRNLTARTLELYSSTDNKTFRKEEFQLDKPDKDTVIMDGFRVKARYLKVHYASGPDTKYEFTNTLDMMLWAFAPRDATGRFGFELEDPLFEELFGDAPGPTRFFAYTSKYDGRRSGEYFRRALRATAKRFGARYVVDEQLDEAARYNLILYGKMSEPEYKKRGIVTRSRPIERPPGMPLISLPDGSLPLVMDGQGWLMDPRFLEQFARDVEERARERDYWCIPQLDEIWTGYAIKPVPRALWYKEVEEADKEIREKYGFGKYGMPESLEDSDPFKRIAYRRWASDKLTETFAKAYRAAKAVNPEMKLVGPTHGSNATSADMAAWAPYFDIMGGQCSGGSTDCLFDWVRVGANTKLYVDVTEKPIWMMVHLAKDHADVRDPEYIREMYSQVFRNGGQGLWLMSKEFFERELEDAMFCEPAKWRAVLELVKVIRTMRLPRLPEPDCAILFSCDSTNTTIYGGLSYHNDQIVSAYTVVGPCLRSWPKFVTDRQIERGDRDLGDYKVLYVPYAAYQAPPLLDRIKSYVRAGGVLVCTDTDAFTWNINGERYGEEWEELTGVRKIGPRKTDAIMKTVTPNPLPLARPIGLTALVPGSRIVPLNDNVTNIAVFNDGSPAVTLHPYGKGKVIFFAADPFYSVGKGKAKRSVVALGSPIVKLIEAIQKAAGVKMGLDIWRFKLPPYRIDVYQKETDLCLTGNYVYDANEPLLEPNNLRAGGTYTYSRAPTAIRDEGDAGEPIPFTSGHLTNRLEAFRTRLRRGRRPRNREQLDKITAQWIVGWDDPAPVSVTFDLKGEHPLSKLRFFYSATAPALTVSGSRDGKTWKRLATASEETAGEDVKDATLPLSGRYRYVKLDFARREEGQAFELCEVEIWGEP